MSPPSTRPTSTPTAIRNRSPSWEACMLLAVEHPLLTVEQIAGLLQRPVGQVSMIMRNDAFLEERAKRIIERYGDKITGIRGQVLDTMSDGIEAIRRRIADPNSDVAPDILLKAVEFLSKFVLKQVDAAPAAGQPSNPVNVSVTLTSNEMQLAQQARRQAINAIDITPQPTPSQPALPKPEERT